MSITKYTIAGILAASLLAACSKSEEYDIKGDPSVKFFVNNTGLGNAPINSISFTVVNRPSSSGTGNENLNTSLPATVTIPVLATRPVGEEVVIGAEMDNTLIEAYNDANNTSYAALPAGFLSASGLSARIPKGASLSSEPISMAVDFNALTSLTEEAYLAPVKLTTVSNTGVGEITSNKEQQVIYVVISTELRRINYGAGEADVLGTLIDPRSGWLVSLSPAPGIEGSIIDGSNNTYSRWNVNEGVVDVNMQETKNITGFRLRTGSSSNTSPTQVVVSLSNDGINYQQVGAVVRNDLLYDSGYTYIIFYGPIPASYIRLGLTYSTSGSSQNRRIAELDVYSN